MRVESTNNHNRTANLNFNSVRKIKYVQEFNPKKYAEEANAVKTFKNSNAIANFAQKHDFIAKFYKFFGKDSDTTYYSLIFSPVTHSFKNIFNKTKNSIPVEFEIVSENNHKEFTEKINNLTEDKLDEALQNAVESKKIANENSKKYCLN